MDMTDTLTLLAGDETSTAGISSRPAVDDIDQDVPDPHDELAAELVALRQHAKNVAIIGSRNIPLPHQQLIESLAFMLAKEGNMVVTSGGSSGTNAAAMALGLGADVTILEKSTDRMEELVARFVWLVEDVGREPGFLFVFRESV